ncbi:MAG: protein translocase subunit SecF [Microbacterium sp.]|nr:protein translocase subunit SecF [Microbacterium sp.]
MRSMGTLGNDLYSGKTSFPFIARRRLWFIIAALLVIGSALVPLFRPVQFSIEFTGGPRCRRSARTRFASRPTR